jgi:hypothetical protein
MKKALSSSKTSVIATTTRRDILEDDILHSQRRENLKSYIALTGWTLKWRRNVSPVRYELRFYIPEDDILHSHRRENLKSYFVFKYFIYTFHPGITFPYVFYNSFCTLLISCLNLHVLPIHFSPLYSHFLPPKSKYSS